MRDYKKVFIYLGLLIIIFSVALWICGCATAKADTQQHLHFETYYGCVDMTLTNDFAYGDIGKRTLRFSTVEYGNIFVSVYNTNWFVFEGECPICSQGE